MLELQYNNSQNKDLVFEDKIKQYGSSVFVITNSPQGRINYIKSSIDSCKTEEDFKVLKEQIMSLLIEPPSLIFLDLQIHKDFHVKLYQFNHILKGMDIVLCQKVKYLDSHTTTSQGVALSKYLSISACEVYKEGDDFFKCI